MPLDWENTSRGGEASLDMDIAAPLWQRPWVRWLSGIAVLGLILLLAGWRAASYRRAQQRLSSEIAARTQELSEKNRALEQADSERASLLQRLEHQAMHDALTGLPNRRAFETLLERHHKEARAACEPLSVAFCDIDEFKKVNDLHGHDAGDRVIKAIADTLARISNDHCHVARHGGEEFVMLFRGMTPTQAAEKLDDAREALADRRLINRKTDEPFGQITFSGGVADIFGYGDTRAALKAADGALYKAKAAGRNRVEIAEAA